MNILYIGSSSDWHVSLWTRYFVRSYNVYLFSDKEDYLTPQNFDKKIIVIEKEGYLGGVLNSFNINTHFTDHINKIISVRKFVKCIDEVINEYDIEIVHAHSLYYGYLLAKINSEVPIVFTPMGSDVIIHAQTNLVYKYMAKKIFSRADIVTNDSVLLQNCGLKVGASRDNNYIIQNGVDSEIFFPKENDVKYALGLAETEILIFSPRAITKIYNIDIIIKSIALLRDAGYPVKCMFSYAFGGEYLEKLKKLIASLSLESNIIWLGYLEYHEMALYYNAADIVVSVPSSDSSPKSVYEAMFCEKPIVISDLEWSYELLSDSECFSRVAVRDSESLYMAIKYILDNPDYANKIAANANKHAHKYYDYCSNMMEMEKIMLAVVSRNSAVIQ